MTLKALFAIPIVVILLVTLSLAGMTVSQEWAGHSRGALAIAATDRAGLLTELEQHLSKERTVTWKAFEADYPLPERMRAELENTRTETVQAINAMIVMLAREAREGGTQSGIPAEFPHAVLASLLQARARSDALLSIEPRWRSHEALSSVMPVMLGPSVLFGPLLARAGIELIDAEPELAGTIVVARIGLQLREELVAISSVMLPRINAREKPSEAELDQVRSLLAQADVTARIMEVTFYLTNPSPVMRTALARANAAREATIQWQLDKAIDAGPLDARINRPIVWLSWPIEYLGRAGERPAHRHHRRSGGTRAP